MNICERGHEEVVYLVRICPMCSLLEEIVQVTKEMNIAIMELNNMKESQME